ncbi:MAG: DUF2335 domain-containing protein [Brevinematales bacterium]|nr:DUF2335 domain-containing protein [Brevinematales bacterium]
MEKKSEKSEKSKATLQSSDPVKDAIPIEQISNLIQKTLQATIKTTLQASIKQTIHSGPLPTPRDLAAYKKVLPNLAEKIVTMAEKEQDFRHSRIDKDNDAEIKNNKAGLIGTIIITTSGLILGFILAILGHTGEAIAAIGFGSSPGIASIVSEILKKRKDN